MKSQEIVVAAPLSFAGSAQRIWPLTKHDNVWLRRLVIIPSVIVLIGLAWVLITCWYVVWGIWLIPYRLIRRGQRKQKLDQVRHEELLDSIGVDKK